MIKQLRTLLLLFPAVIISACNDSIKTDSPVHAGQGIMVGEVTATKALIQVRLTKTDQLIDREVPGIKGVVEFTLSESNSDPQIVAAIAEHDHIARIEFSELKPGTQYNCKTRIGSDKESLSDGPTATFKTLPGAESNEIVRFVVVTGMNYGKFHGDDRIDRAIHLRDNNTALAEPYSGPDKELGYPALETILNTKAN